MRLLVMATGLPCPPDSGRKLRMYHLYGLLARTHRVTWLSRNDARDRPDLLDTERIFERVVVTSRQSGPWSDRRGARGRAMLNRARSAMGNARYELEAEQAAALDALLAEGFDAVVLDSEAMAPYVARASGDTPWLLNTQNVPSVFARREWRNARTLRRRLRAWVSYRSCLVFERVLFPEFAAVTVVSELERRTLADRFPRTKVVCVPNGVPRSLTSFGLPSRRGCRLLNFTGNFHYHPNPDAIRWFCADILPEILRCDSRVELQLVGRDSDLVAASLPAGLPVSALGRVADPVVPLGDCAAVVAPLRRGGGTRLKILEALALGRPVVATTVGAEGIELDESCGLLRADEPSDFAAKVMRALTDPDVRAAAETRGRASIAAKYTWETAAESLEDCLAAVAGSGRR